MADKHNISKWRNAFNFIYLLTKSSRSRQKTQSICEGIQIKIYFSRKVESYYLLVSILHISKELEIYILSAHMNDTSKQLSLRLCNPHENYTVTCIKHPGNKPELYIKATLPYLE